MSNTTINLLVADDATTVHQIIERAAAAYSGEHIQCIHALDGRECVQALARGNIDLAFVDVIMPEMSGLDALGHARTMGNGTFMTVMSAQPNARVFQLARELGAYEFLFKPFGAKDVDAILKSYARIRRPMRVLVVDDSTSTRAIIHRVLERSIFRLDIEEAKSGDRAVALYEAQRFDLVFLDCNMPDVDGWETLQRLRRHDASTRVIMMSAERGKSLDHDALERGAAAFLYKPFYPTDIDGVLHRLFDLRSPRLTVFRPGVLNRFDVSIVGRTVEVRHRDSGHLYRFLWFRETPYLRGAQVVPNAHSRDAATAFVAEAENAAALELQRIGVLDGGPPAPIAASHDARPASRAPLSIA